MVGMLPRGVYTLRRVGECNNTGVNFCMAIGAKNDSAFG